jgi:hypothetical protein
MNATDALARHKLSVLDNACQEVFVNRSSDSILRDVFKKLKRGEIEVTKMFDVTFIGEEGIDARGLTKEFFTIMMNSLKCGSGSYIPFEGSDDHLLPVISKEYHQGGFFNYAGQLIAMSVLHAGFGFSGMSRALSVFLSTNDMDRASCHLSVKDVPDYGIQEILREVSTAKIVFAC